MSSGKVIVYGGRGALGSIVVEDFKKAGYWVLNVDLNSNEAADANVLASIGAKELSEQSELVLKGCAELLADSKVDAVISVAGGWAGGNADSADFLKNVDLCVKQSVWTSAITAKLAANYVKEGGLVVLPGAAAAQAGTSGMIGYGAAKAYVHQMTKSLAGENSGLPAGVGVFATCPITIDTPMNRKWMAGADFGTWTTREFISDLFMQWMEADKRPENGSLVSMVTKDYNTVLSYQ